MPTGVEWARRQHDSDLRLVAFCDALDADAIDAWVELPRRDHVQRDRAGHVLAHLFNHQTHHRGQAHAMLSGTAVAPPQLDEFMMPSEAHLRRDDMRALGWDETSVYGRTRDAMRCLMHTGAPFPLLSMSVVPTYGAALAQRAAAPIRSLRTWLH